MDYRPLDLTLISAKDLKDVNLVGKMDVYAVAWLSNDQRQKQKTNVSHDGGKNPSWNFTVRFNIDESAARNGGLIIQILLRCEKALGDKDVGEVAVPVKELLEKVDSKTAQFVSYQVRTPNGKPKGILNLSYKFGERIAAPSAPCQAPPVAHSASFEKSDVAAYPATAVPYMAPGAYPPGQAYPTATWSLPPTATRSVPSTASRGLPAAATRSLSATASAGGLPSALRLPATSSALRLPSDGATAAAAEEEQVRFGSGRGSAGRSARRAAHRRHDLRRRGVKLRRRV